MNQSWVSPSIPQNWQTWTPSPTNLSGGTQTYANYVKFGKTTFAKFLYTLAGAGVAGDVGFTLPVTAAADYAFNGEIIGQVFLRDANSTDYLGAVQLTSNTTAVIRYTAPALTALSSTVPFTWASSDTISFEIFYNSL